MVSKETLEPAAAVSFTEQMQFLIPYQHCESIDGKYWQLYKVPLTLARFTLHYEATGEVYGTQLFTTCQLTIDQTRQVLQTGFAALQN